MVTVTGRATVDGAALTATATLTVTAPAQPTNLPPLLGNSWENWAGDKTTLQSTGGQFEAARIFYADLTENPAADIATCKQQNVAPVVSFKPGAYTWKQIGDGAADAALTTLANRIKTALNGSRLYFSFHHEPSKQSLGKTTGEGGPATEYARAWTRILDVMRPITGTGVQYGPILNGWWFSDQARKFSDAEVSVWLPPALRARLDFIGADDYTESGGEKAVTRSRNRVAMLKRMGFAGYTVVGETNVPFQDPLAADFVAVFNYAKTEPLFAGGFVCLWNGTAGNYKPVQQTGLTGQAQAVVKTWRD